MLGTTSPKAMNTQRALSILTFLLGLHAVWDVTQLTSTFDVPGVWSHAIPRVVVAIFGLLGGVLLWKGTWLGYLGSTIAWATTLVTDVNLTAVETASGVFISVTAIVSIPVLVAFCVAIRAKKRSERT
jgi:hypothetical protein